MIVNNARDKQAHLFGSAVTHIGFGVGTNPVTPTDNSLVNAYWKPVSAVRYPDSGQVAFDWTLLAAEANGMTITEMALRTADGVVIARKVRGAISKDADLSLAGTWIVKF
ncbi:MAG: hypothetical protein HY849_00250 [Nitrosomonadales bacterium]|nr:hypothetical protein [Nitrosomonadales bacterium]